MMNKAKHYIDWITLKFMGFVVYVIHLLEKYDEVIDIITKNIGRIGVILGVCTMAIRFYRTLKNKSTNGS